MHPWNVDVRPSTFIFVCIFWREIQFTWLFLGCISNFSHQGKKFERNALKWILISFLSDNKCPLFTRLDLGNTSKPVVLHEGFPKLSWVGNGSNEISCGELYAFHQEGLDEFMSSEIQSCGSTTKSCTFPKLAKLRWEWTSLLNKALTLPINCSLSCDCIHKETTKITSHPEIVLPE